MRAHTFTPKRVAVVGAAGYAGAELAAILLRHSHAEIVGLFGSPGSAERVMSDEHPRFRGLLDQAIQPCDADAIAALEPDAVFLATPHEASVELAAQLVRAGLVVLDLSAAYRLKDAALYPAHYGFEHAQTGLLADAAYGLCELVRDHVAESDLIAVPGCYPTGAILALRPLVAIGAIDPQRTVIVDAVSGVSGAGRGAKTANLFCEVSLAPYGVLAHRHEPEISAYAHAPIAFVPHVAPYERGLVCTMHAELDASFSEDNIRAMYESRYGPEAFIRVLPKGAWPSVRGVAHTNFVDLAFAVRGSHLVVCTAIDNLVKGAAGQAVQCMNIRLGLPETAGLLADHTGVEKGVSV